MRTRIKIVLFGIVAAVATATGLTLSMSGGAASTPAPIGDGSVAALSQPSTGSDALPNSVTQMPSSSWVSAPRGARLVLDDGTYRAWIAPGADDSICLATQTVNGQSSGLVCAPRKTLLSGPIYSGTRIPGGGVDLIGVVDDAVTRVSAGNESVAVRNNVFRVKNVESQALTLDTTGGRRNYDLPDWSHPLATVTR